MDYVGIEPYGRYPAEASCAPGLLKDGLGRHHTVPYCCCDDADCGTTARFSGLDAGAADALAGVNRLAALPAILELAGQPVDPNPEFLFVVVRGYDDVPAPRGHGGGWSVVQV